VHKINTSSLRFPRFHADSGDEVAKQSAAVAAMAEHWPLIDDVMGGTPAMRKASINRLPKWPAEETKSYEARLNTATMFPAYPRTISVLTGKPFSKEITIQDDRRAASRHGSRTWILKAAISRVLRLICSATR
jgi:hypothetical protein